MSSLVGDLLLLNRDKTQSLEHVPVDISHVCTDEVSRSSSRSRRRASPRRFRPGIVVEGDEAAGCTRW